MKKFLSFLILPIIALMCLVGCKDNRTIGQVKEQYNAMVMQYKEGDSNIFFSDPNNPNSIKLSYPDSLVDAISIVDPSNDLQRRYKALLVQQKILDDIFAYYENNNEDFYREIGSKTINKDDILDLFNKIVKLRETLSNFKVHYDNFLSALENGISDIMEFNITSYSFELNKVISASFDFMYKFHSMYVGYCASNYDEYIEKNLKIYVDKAYVDKAYIIFLQNVKAFDYSVGDNGVCDLSKVVGSKSDFSLLSGLNEKKVISAEILDSLTDKKTLNALNEFVYYRDVFEQRVGNFASVYNSLDVYTISQYKFDLVSGVDYNSYIKSLPVAERATTKMLDNFVNDVYSVYMEKLEAVVK